MVCSRRPVDAIGRCRARSVPAVFIQGASRGEENPISVPRQRPDGGDEEDDDDTEGVPGYRQDQGGWDIARAKRRGEEDLQEEEHVEEDTDHEEDGQPDDRKWILDEEVPHEEDRDEEIDREEAGGEEELDEEAGGEEDHEEDDAREALG